MKKYACLILLIFLISCSQGKGVYWCGDHPCINKKEKEAYFRETMIVEVRNFDKRSIKKDSEIEKLLNQAKIKEKERIISEKELIKNSKLEEKELKKRLKLEEKKRIREEKELAKKIKIDEKKLKEKNNKVNKITKKNTNDKPTFTNLETSSKKFNEIAMNIIERNSDRPFPEINDIEN
tara:strand:- start:1902 stop:2438 length:537 start_codon:yes stop_codon:yes gene_type:complete